MAEACQAKFRLAADPAQPLVGYLGSLADGVSAENASTNNKLAERHRPHAEDDRTGKREALACRVHEPECLDRREVESESHVTAPRVLRKGGWRVEAIRLEGSILAELWLDESTRRERGPNLGIVSLSLVLLHVATAGVIVGRAVEQL